MSNSAGVTSSLFGSISSSLLYSIYDSIKSLVNTLPAKRKSWFDSRLLIASSRVPGTSFTFDCSSGGNYFDQEIELKKGYQVPLSKSIKSQAEILTGTVGLITENDHAEEILNNNEADAIFLGRELLRNPYWSLYSQEDIKAWPLQYQRSFESIGNIKYVRKND